ncbi:DUF222 domain-containing protein [Actinomadura barringtoniae]|uniref:DUF222 domain-containing protein n=1 Tax=Actinomadura barringtoniae TaxID=1427535 RepID=A0A939PB66_9ACTN|nr:HNH endonuclease signature motif containing protein [Actinomadura barringtoniae]MBO2446074.1 DUF222 domain-containing protein [Actinomadura barringtoniae]
MSSIVAGTESASTQQLVEAASVIFSELADRAAPESGAACMELAEALATVTDQAEHVLAGLIAVVDRTGEMKAWGLPSTQAWLRCRMGMREGRAKERITLARQLHRLGRVDKGLAAGELSFGYAATIADAVQRLNDDDTAAAEDILLTAAGEGLSAGKVAKLGGKIHDLVREHNGEDKPPEDVQRGYERSWVTVSRSLDGGCYLKGWLNPEDTAILDGTLAPLAKPAGTDDRRDLGERTAAALTSVLAGGHGATRVTVIADLETLTGADTPGRLRDGTPIPAEQVRRLALTAGISPLIFGRGHIPLYLGHTVRIASAGQRRVLETLYDTCAVHGCEVPGFLCEVDHVDGWALGSPTDIDKLTLCCGWHNRWKHTNPQQMQISKSDGRFVYRTLAPDGIARARRSIPEHDANPWRDDQSLAA